jgi:hypothetical protein
MASSSKILYLVHPKDCIIIRDRYGKISRYPAGLGLPDDHYKAFFDKEGYAIVYGDDGSLDPRYWAVQRYKP